MQQLIETQNNKVKFLINKNYTQLYNKLKTILPEELYSFFARPDVFTNHTNWSCESKPLKVLTFDKLSDEDKDEICDSVEFKKQKISELLINDSEFKTIVDKIFKIPSEKDVYILKTEYEIVPIITQWGCDSNDVKSTVDALSHIISRPRTNSAKVIIEIFYTDGSKAIAKPFFIEYKGAEGKEKTNNEGIYNRGRCKLNTTFKVYDIVDGEKKYFHEFTVLENVKYIVNFPLFVPLTIKVVNQNNLPMSNIPVIINYDGTENTQISDKVGFIHLTNFEVGKNVIIKEKDDTNNTVEHKIVKEKNVVILKIFRPILTTGNVKVVDDENNLLLNYPITIEYNGTEKDYSTTASGILLLKDIEVGRNIKIVDKNNLSNFKEYLISETDNEFILTIIKEKPIVIPPKEPKFIKVRLIDHKDKPIIKTKIDFDYKGEKMTIETDENGICELPADNFKDKDRIKAIIHLVKEKSKKK